MIIITIARKSKSNNSNRESELVLLCKQKPRLKRGWGLSIKPIPYQDASEKGKATQSSILDWRIAWTEDPGAIVHRIAKSGTRLKRLSTNAPGYLERSQPQAHRWRYRKLCVAEERTGVSSVTLANSQKL